MKATVKQIFEHISYLNPETSEISSIGSYVSQSSQIVADLIRKKAIESASIDSLAYKILTSGQSNFSQKQLWVIAFELERNELYVEKLGTEIANESKKIAATKDVSKSKLAENKSNAQPVLDMIKENGKKLGDYYTWLKTSSFKKEFFNKKYSVESANAFLGL